jgi:hypothetical protein
MKRGFGLPGRRMDFEIGNYNIKISGLSKHSRGMTFGSQRKHKPITTPAHNKTGLFGSLDTTRYHRILTRIIVSDHIIHIDY